MKNLGIIGCGNMGEAIVKQILGKANKSLKFKNIIISEQDATKVKALKRKYKLKITDIIDVVRLSDVIIIAVKPQDIDVALHEIKLGISKKDKKLFVSIAAGISTAYIERKIAKSMPVVRVMPNMPGQIGKGVSAISRGRFASKSDVGLVDKIFQLLGQTVFIKERQMDAVTAVSGSGPAYVSLFLHSFIKAAEESGLDPKLSRQLVFSTTAGTLSLTEGEDNKPEDLVRKVSSKGGTTEAAFQVFKKNKFQITIKKAVFEAKKKSQELSRR